MKVTKQEILTRILLVIGILILVNVLSANYFVRLDFTADQRYTLSSATERVLQDVDQPITITAYFSEDLPAQISQTKRDFRSLLVEYQNHASSDFVYNFVNPNKDEESEQEAQRKGIRPMLAGSQDRDKVQRQRVYMGAEIKIGGETEVISAIQPGAAMEYKLSSGIRKIANIEKPKVAVFQGHNEVGKEDLGKVMDDLSVLYKVENHELSGDEPIPEEYRSGILIHPEDSFSSQEMDRLNEFLSQGNNLFIATNPMKRNQQTQQGTVRNIGIENWLADKGFAIQENLVVDVECGSVTVRRRAGGRMFNQPVKFPFFPIIKNFKDHTVTEGLSRVFTPFASELQLKDTLDNARYQILGVTSGQSGRIALPTRFDPQKNWTENDFPDSEIPVAAAAEGNLAGEASNSRMVVVACNNFVPKQSGNNQQQQQQIQDGNADMLVNAVNWISDELGLTELRTQTRKDRPIDEVEDNTKAMIKYGNTFVPIILILLIGGIRYRIQQNKRAKWMAV